MTRGGGLNSEMYEAMELFKTGQLKTEEKLRLISKFGEGRPKWSMPVQDIEKQFTVELIILQLEAAKKQKKKDMINLAKEQIQWLIQEAI